MNDEEHSKDRSDINHELGSFHFAVWLGALFRYLVRFGQKPFNEIYKSEFRRRNFWTGFSIQVLTCIILIVALVMFS